MAFCVRPFEMKMDQFSMALYMHVCVQCHPEATCTYFESLVHGNTHRTGYEDLITAAFTSSEPYASAIPT